MPEDETAPRRRYDSPLRRERAAATRAAVIEAAAEAFSERGYAGATLAHIAAAAGVSTDTVGLVGTKSFLLLEAYRTRYAGHGGWKHLMEDEDTRKILDIRDPGEAVEATIEFLVEGHRRSAQLWAVLRATASADAQVAEELDELCRLKTESFEQTTRWLIDIDVLPAPESLPVQMWGADPDQAFRRLVAEVALLMSAEAYLILRNDHGYSDDEYRTWLRSRLAYSVGDEVITPPAGRTE